MKTIETFNQAIFLLLNATPDSPHWLVAAGILLADYAIWIAPALLVYLWLTGARNQREVAVRAAFTAMVALGINQLIGMAWYHPRPFAMGLGHTFLIHAPDSSFPSDHATLLSAISITLLYDGRRLLGGCALLVDIAVAWARVYVGVHFPLDMVGAGIVAWASCLLAAPIWRFAGAAATQACVALYRKVLAGPIARGWLRP
jgi:undecaprenyl-diphosphatase